MCMKALYFLMIGEVCTALKSFTSLYYLIYDFANYLNS